MPGITDPNILAHLAENDEVNRVRAEAVKHLTDQGVLARICKNERDLYVRKFAVPRVTDQSVLADIVMSDDKSLDAVIDCENGARESMREAALARVTDQRVLADIAKNYGTKRQTALKRVTDASLLPDIAENAKTEDVREKARRRIAGQAVLYNLPDDRQSFKVRSTQLSKDPGSAVVQVTFKKVTFASSARDPYNPKFTKEEVSFQYSLDFGKTWINVDRARRDDDVYVSGLPVGQWVWFRFEGKSSGSEIQEYNVSAP